MRHHRITALRQRSGTNLIDQPGEATANGADVWQSIHVWQKVVVFNKYRDQDDNT